MSKGPAARSTLDIALWFQARSESAGERLAPRKLHFLLYLAQALYAGENEGRKLMPGTFLAGEVGPVEPNIYALFEAGVPESQPTLNDTVEEFLNEVWGRFGRDSAREIERFVLRDGVWEIARKLGKNAEIPIELMTKVFTGSRVLGLKQARDKAASQHTPDEVFLTPSGQGARKWIPGGSGASAPPGSGASAPLGSGDPAPLGSGASAPRAPHPAPEGPRRDTPAARKDPVGGTRRILPPPGKGPGRGSGT